MSALLAAREAAFEPHILISKAPAAAAAARQSRAKRGARRKAGPGEEEPVRDVVGEEDPGTRPLGC